jgi:hypothetical protein
VISRGVQSIKDAHSKEQQDYEYATRAAESAEGLEDKKAAIQEIISQLDLIEKELLDRGAKTFRELHPNVNYSGYSNNNRREPREVKFPEIFFSHDPDLTPTRAHGYIDLLVTSSPHS